MAVGDYDILAPVMGEAKLIGYDDALIGMPSSVVIRDMQTQAYAAGLSGGYGDVSSLGAYGSTGNTTYADLGGSITYVASTPSGEAEDAPDDSIKDKGIVDNIITKENIMIGAAILVLLVATTWLLKKL